MAKLSIASPDLRRPDTGADFEVCHGIWREGEVVDFQVPPYPSSRMVHLHMQEKAKPN